MAQPTSTVGGLPPVTTMMAGVGTVSCITANLFPSTVNMFALVPVNTMTSHFYLWNILTCGLFEARILHAVVMLPALLYLGKEMETHWGSGEFAKCVLLVNIITALATFFTCYIAYVFEMHHMMSQYYGGFLATIGALTVGIRQRNPDFILNVGFLSCRSKWLPFMLFLIVTVFDFVVRNGPGSKAQSTQSGDAAAGTLMPFLTCGIYGGWIYLRFYQTLPDRLSRQGKPLHGDNTDHFAFQTLFPDPLQPVIRLLATACYRLVRIIGCCSAWQEELEAVLASIEEEERTSGRQFPPTTVEDEVAKRRIQQAQEALELRLRELEENDDETFDIQDNGIV